MSSLAGRRFVTPAAVETQVFDWGTIKWLSEPRVTGTERFTMGVVLLQPGKGHVRHNHPGTEEILYVVSGQGKQMIAVYSPPGPEALLRAMPECRVLAPGELPQT